MLSQSELVSAKNTSVVVSPDVVSAEHAREIYTIQVDLVIAFK